MKYKTILGIFLIAVLFNVSVIMILQLDSKKPKNPKYMAVSILTKQPLSEICEEKSINSCGITLSKCATPGVSFECMVDVAILQK